MGLETHLRRHSQETWYEQANAGLEDMPLGSMAANLPYVVKTPWVSEFVNDLLANQAIHIDAVIIPIRDLAEAATSRVVQELRALHHDQPWQGECSHTSETWGVTAGGVVFSLNPVDQGRLLAVWLYQLIQRLEHAEIPTVFLDFPRFAEDPAYLFRKLRPFLPGDATVEQARAVHAQTADRQKIRVGDEMRSTSAAPVHPGVDYPAPEALDRIALTREISRLKAELARSRAAAGAAATPAVAENPAAVEVLRVAEPQKGLATLARALARRLAASRLPGR
jgi:hypothetical protein